MTNIFTDLRDAIASGVLTHTELADGTGVLLDIRGGQVLTLNETGELLVQAICEAKSSPEDLADVLVDRHGIDKDTALRDCNEFLEHLSGKITLS